MRMRSFAIGVIALLMLSPYGRLEATPILSDPLHGLALNGFGIDFNDDVLGSYDASLDALRISSLRQNAEFRSPLGTALVFTSFFELTAGVDEFGRVTNRGTISWEGDFGAGRELLATGKLLDVGFDTLGLSPDITQQPNVFSLMRLLLNFDFLDARVAGLGSDVGLFFERQWPTVLDSPFMQDWDCPTGGGAGPGCLQSVSTSGMAGVVVGNVPEPSSLVLFGIALGVMGSFRRRRHTSVQPS